MYDGADPTAPLLGSFDGERQLCANTTLCPPFVVQSSGGSMHILFETDSSGNAAGFEAITI